jgi:hypothetical protein
MAATPEAYFRRNGLKPLTWEEVLHTVEAKLTPSDLETFRRRHRNFVGYPVEHTCRAFYDFAGKHDLLDLLASFRFERLCRIAACLSPLPLRGCSILELGAGGGHLSGYLREELGADVSVTDWCTENLFALEEEGFETFTGPQDASSRRKRFDFILCADSLGEVNADEDSWLREPENATDPEYAERVEQRYGFVGKLAPWKPRLTPGGSILLFEPIGLPFFWEGVAASFAEFGWKAEILGPDPVWGVVALPTL